MGLINGLQVQALSALFAIRMPTNALEIMIMIMNLASFDVFNTEKIYMKIFRFKETDSYNSIFDDAGFSGSNFILGIGPMFMMMVYYCLYLAFREMVLRNFTGDYYCEKKIVPYFRKHHIEGTVLRFILEGNLEISFWSFICALYVKKNGIGIHHWSDVFSNILAFIMLLLVPAAPIITLYRANQFFKLKK